MLYPFCTKQGDIGQTEQLLGNRIYTVVITGSCMYEAYKYAYLVFFVQPQVQLHVEGLLKLHFDLYNVFQRKRFTWAG